MSQISISSDQDNEFHVEEILDSRIMKGRPEYLIRWQGYEGQNTWEPLTNLKYVLNMVQDFEKKKSRKNESTNTNNNKKKKNKHAKSQSTGSDEHSPKKSQSPEKNEKTSIVGNYDENDSAKEILNIRSDGSKKLIEFYVAWKQRKTKRTPQPTWVTDEILKLHNPEVLCDYLLQKIKWPKFVEE